LKIKWIKKWREKGLKNERLFLTGEINEKKKNG
jgi:hypothetical protein